MRFLRMFAWLWVAALLATGVAGGVLMDRVGWALAQGMAIYGGDTEPARVDLPFAWHWLAVAAALALGGLGWAARDRRRAALGDAPGRSLLRAALPLAVAYLGALGAALLPFVHLFRLVALTGPGTTP